MQTTITGSVGDTCWRVEPDLDGTWAAVVYSGSNGLPFAERANIIHWAELEGPSFPTQAEAQAWAEHRAQEIAR